MKVFDYYLKCNTKEDLLDSLIGVGILLGSVNDYRINGNYSLDLIGSIFEPTGEIDPEGEPVMQVIEGYHANLRTRQPLGTEITDLLPIIPKPNNPVRLWA